ncbi:MAG: hypothetical protein MdMp014T_2577 [Treponematales bacterium]
MSNELIQLYEAIAELGENESLEPEIKTSTETNEKKEIVSSSILQPEIHNSMETDRYYYQTGVDAYTKGDYDSSIRWMHNLKIKFPRSPLIPEAEKMVENSIMAIGTANIEAIEPISPLNVELANDFASNGIKEYLPGYAKPLNAVVTKDLNKYDYKEGDKYFGIYEVYGHEVFAVVTVLKDRQVVIKYYTDEFLHIDGDGK